MWLIALFVGTVICVFLYRRMRENYDDGDKPQEQQEQSVCSSQCGSVGSDGTNLLPITDPEFNLRECAKQMILLEDHLFNPQKRCSDCIKKHCMSIEALAEEGASLTKGQQTDPSTESTTCYQECNDLARVMRRLEKDYIDGRDPADIARELRQVRKPLMGKYFMYMKE